MKKKVLLVTGLVTAIIGTLAGCGTSSSSSTSSGTSSTSEAASKSLAENEVTENGSSGSSESSVVGKKIGFINAGPDDYYAAYGDALVAMAKQYGMDVTEVNSNYSSETELSNCQDLISSGVDAIACITAGAAGSAKTIKTAQDVGVPIFFCVGQPETEEGYSYTGWVSDNYAILAYNIGKYVTKNYSESSGKIALIPGVLGQNTAEAEIVGFNMALEENGFEDAYVTASGNWAAADAIPVVEDLVSSGKDIDVIFACNEEMARGTIQVLEEKKLSEQIAVVSINAKDEGLQWVSEGKVSATISDCPNRDADLCVQQMVAYFTGQDYEKSLNIANDVEITKDSIDQAMPGDLDKYEQARKDGTIQYELSYYEEQAEKNADLFTAFDENTRKYIDEHN